MQLITIILTTIILLSYNGAHAATSNIVTTPQASIQLIAGGYATDQQLKLGLHFKLKPGWKIYWQDPGDSGYPPSLTWSGSTNIKTTNLKWPMPERFQDQITADFISESYGYKNEVILPIYATTNNSSHATNIRLHVDYAICKQICISDTAELQLQIPGYYNNPGTMQQISTYEKLIPQPNGTDGLYIKKVQQAQSSGNDHFLYITATSDSLDLSSSNIFVSGGDNYSFYLATKQIINNQHAVFTVPITYHTDQKTLNSHNFAITLTTPDNAVSKSVKGEQIGHTKVKPTQSINTSNYKLYTILLFAFIGGLILNIMPCVLPVLSLKLLSVINKTGCQKNIISKSFLTTSAGIIFSFILLSCTVILLQSLGKNVGWGFHFQEPAFIFFLIIVLCIFAANLWGIFSFRGPCIDLDNTCPQESESFTRQFLTGALATILATPCTAPFLGTAVGFAVSQGAFEILLIFTIMGIGMAFPYIFFSIFPQAISILPKPGNWMLTFKKFLSILLAITALWLSWVLYGQLNPTDINKQNTTKWQKLNQQQISQLVADNHVVFVDVTADWCLTCKINKIMVLESQSIKEFFANNNVITMRADWTNKDDSIQQFLFDHNRSGIPFNIVYGPNSPTGIILSELLSKNEVIKAIKNAK